MLTTLGASFLGLSTLPIRRVRTHDTTPLAIWGFGGAVSVKPVKSAQQTSLVLDLWMHSSNPITHLQNGVPKFLQNGCASHWYDLVLI
jgi:hypothetical protein